jgi:alanyl-tRNA synthetase
MKLIMDSKDLRQAFLNFFEKKGHKIIPSSSLISQDRSVLFTTAGMQQFKEYYLEKSSPYGQRVASCQKCFRTSDIEEVGDRSHLTFLEMLGNFSFGDYFKKEAIEWALEFLTEDLGIPEGKLRVTYFKGSGEIPEDIESRQIWQNLGFPKNRIFKFDKEDNFWGPTGKEGPCGPTTEIHYDLTGKPCRLGVKCAPNCKCGRFVEIWNLVFNEYYQDDEKRLTPLKRKGVDTGMGLERLAEVCQGKTSVYETDLFLPIIQEIKKSTGNTYDNLKAERIIADHIKSSVFIISDGIFPSNLGQGYVLRRLLRRAIRYGKILGCAPGFLVPLAQKVVGIYKDVYPEVKSKETDILTVIQNEEEKFGKTLEKGLKIFEKISSKGSISGIDAFHLYDTYGFPLELTEELSKERGVVLDKHGFEKAFKEHREVSRAGVEKKFGGVGKEATYEMAKLHTATHLLHAALRKVLGNHVKQMGSDITPQRLRFDFLHPQKMTIEEIKEVENLVNQKIKDDLEVKKEKMSLGLALKSGALAFFKEKYPETVTVYTIREKSGNFFSKEICAGPHVNRTSELGNFKIIREESSGAGIRRIRGILE